jgi:hypothetical protein
MRQYANVANQWARGVAGWPNPLASRPHLAASHGFASR